MAKRPKNPKNSVFSRLNYLSKKMTNPKITAKEMKVLKLREKNLMEMMEDGMEEFKEGGKVTKEERIKKKRAKAASYRIGNKMNKDNLPHSKAMQKKKKDMGNLFNSLLKSTAKKKMGGRIRGDGIAVRGKTKGTIR